MLLIYFLKFNSTPCLSMPIPSPGNPLMQQGSTVGVGVAAGSSCVESRGGWIRRDACRVVTVVTQLRVHSRVSAYSRQFNPQTTDVLDVTSPT